MLMNIPEGEYTNIKELTRIMSELAITTPVDENTAKIPVITHLAELETISDDALMQVFWQNNR